MIVQSEKGPSFPIALRIFRADFSCSSVPERAIGSGLRVDCRFRDCISMWMQPTQIYHAQIVSGDKALGEFYGEDRHIGCEMGPEAGEQGMIRIAGVESECEAEEG